MRLTVEAVSLVRRGRRVSAQLRGDGGGCLLKYCLSLFPRLIKSSDVEKEQALTAGDQMEY